MSQTTRRPHRGLLLTTRALVILLAAAAFALSYSALRDLAVGAGINPDLAWMWPLIVDGLIVVATLATYALEDRGARLLWYPWGTFILFAALSIAGNAMHSMSNPDITVPPLVAAGVSAVPAVALLIGSHLVFIIQRGLARSSVTPTQGEGRDGAEAPAVDAHSPEGEGGTATTRAAAEGTTTTATKLRAVERAVPGESELVDQLRELVGRGGEVTATAIAELEGCSDRTGRRRLAQLRETHPELFEQEERAS